MNYQFSRFPERRVGENLGDTFKKIKGRIIIATFASNVHRVQQIVEACVATNRKIAIFGRSMEATIKIGLEYGYIHCPEDTFISAKKLSIYHKRKSQFYVLVLKGSL